MLLQQAARHRELLLGLIVETQLYIAPADGSTNRCLDEGLVFQCAILHLCTRRVENLADRRLRTLSRDRVRRP